MTLGRGLHPKQGADATGWPPLQQLLGPARCPTVLPARQPQGSRGTRTAHVLFGHLSPSVYGRQTPCCVIQSFNSVPLFATPGTAAHQASLSFIISQSLLKFKYLSFTFLKDVYFVTMCCIMNLSNLRLLLASNILL